MEFKEIIYYYVIAFLLLMGYYLGDFLGITGWSFQQPLHIMLPVLTIFYGTYLLVVDSFVRKIIGLD